MKWIGQHIYDLVSRFRDDVYFENDLYIEGNVGIGTNFPEYPLEISITHAGSDDDKVALSLEPIKGGNQIIGDGVGILFKTSGAGLGDIGAVGAYIGSHRDNATDANTSTGLTFKVSQNDTAYDDAMTIDSDGNVGIGTTTPINTLDVNGSVGVYASVGPEKVTNGTFSGNATGWTVPSGWTYNSNAVDKDGAGTGVLEQDVGAIANEIYKVQFQISNHSAAWVYAQVGGAHNQDGLISNDGGSVTADGIYTEYITATNTGNLQIKVTGSSRFTIDNISVKKVGSKAANHVAMWVDDTGQWDGNASGNAGLHIRTEKADGHHVIGDKVGIGTFNPATLLHVQENPGDSGTLVTFSNTHDDPGGAGETILELAFPSVSDGTDSNFILFSDGNTAEMGVIKASNATVVVDSYSDYRIKNTIATLTGGLDKVNALRPVTFKYNTDPGDATHEGFIAHEVQEQIPYAVRGAKDAVKDDGSVKAQSFCVYQLIPQLVSAIKELSDKVAVLEARE